MWVRFFVSGKSTAETFRWYSDDDRWTDEDLRMEAEDWADNTSQGRLNDHFRYGFERVAKLPPEAKASLTKKFQHQQESAAEMLAILARE